MILYHEDPYEFLEIYNKNTITLQELEKVKRNFMLQYSNKVYSLKLNLLLSIFMLSHQVVLVDILERYCENKWDIDEDIYNVYKTTLEHQNKRKLVYPKCPYAFFGINKTTIDEDRLKSVYFDAIRQLDLKSYRYQEKYYRIIKNYVLIQYEIDKNN